MLCNPHISFSIRALVSEFHPLPQSHLPSIGTNGSGIKRTTAAGVAPMCGWTIVSVGGVCGCGRCRGGWWEWFEVGSDEEVERGLGVGWAGQLGSGGVGVWSVSNCMLVIGNVNGENTFILCLTSLSHRVF